MNRTPGPSGRTDLDQQMLDEIDASFTVCGIPDPSTHRHLALI